MGHSRSVLSAPPEAIRVPSGLKATLYTSGYVECAYGGFGEGCRKRYDFVLYMDSARRLVHQGREQLLLRALADGAAMSHHIKGVPQAQERQEVIHINTDWRGRAKPGPWYGRYYEDWDAAHPKAWVRGQAVPGRFCTGALWGSSTLAWDAAWFRAQGVEMPKGAHYVVPGRDQGSADRRWIPPTPG